MDAPRGGLVEKNAEWYRARAAECVARAEEATDSRIREFNRAEAETWLRLAELAEVKAVISPSEG